MRGRNFPTPVRCLVKLSIYRSGGRCSGFYRLFMEMESAGMGGAVIRIRSVESWSWSAVWAMAGAKKLRVREGRRV
jgi:hypothetical protein